MLNFSSDQIRSAYVKLCKDPSFPSNLKRPTDARVKKECMALYKKKNSLSDQQVLRNLLELKEDVDLTLALKKANPEKFRPIVNFFKDKTTEPRDETIDLVAWLIDFKSGNLELEQEEKLTITGLSQPYTGDRDDSKKDDDKDNSGDGLVLVKPKSNPLKRAFRNTLVFLCLFTTSIFLFAIKSFEKTSARMPLANEQCMYWTGNHYEPIACRDSSYSLKKTIPLNLKELINLQKINRVDTLTIEDLGKIWYRKIGNKLYLFTSGGRFPLDTNKILKPLTKYMFYEHVANKQYNLLDLLQWHLISYSMIGATILTVLIDKLIIFLTRKTVSNIV